MCIFAVLLRDYSGLSSFIINKVRTKKYLCFLLFALPLYLAAGETIRWETPMLSRTFDITGGQFCTVSYQLNEDKHDFVQATSKEFSFLLNDRLLTGQSGWDVAQRDSSADDGLTSKTFTLNSTQVEGLVVELTYTSYPDVAVVRKQMTIVNRGTSDFKIENLDVEHLATFNTYANGGAWILRHYGRYRQVGPYVGDANDPILLFYEPDGCRGMALGNEAPGVTKRSSMLEDGASMTAGLTHRNQEFPFRKWLAPGERWQAPAVFTAPYSNVSNPYDVLETTIADYTRTYMGIRFEALTEKPMFVYNTWVPFTTNVNDALVRELAVAAAQCGVQEFVIDDGWQICNGDWRVNTQKFPEGLKPCFDYVKSLGMKPGLWVSLATSKQQAPVFKEHPEWFVADSAGGSCNLHTTDPRWAKTACLTTGYGDYIRNVIEGLVQDYGLVYAKLDLAIAASAYMYDKSHSGCYASHPGHRDRNESFLAIYDACTNIFRQLHEDVPELFIDCTFETAGRWHLNDYGLARYAEGNWLANIEESDGLKGVLRVRQLAWQRTPALPASTLVIGNLYMDGKMHMLAFKSLAGTLPIMLGDPRKLSEEERGEFKQWATWLEQVQARHGYMSFRQDLPGFGEPAEGAWDGFMRINTETLSGGLVGVFKHGAKERQRTVTVRYLDKTQRYEVREGGTGNLVCTMTGAALEEKGFTVRLDNAYDGQLFEIRRIE